VFFAGSNLAHSMQHATFYANIQQQGQQQGHLFFFLTLKKFNLII